MLGAANAVVVVVVVDVFCVGVGVGDVDDLVDQDLIAVVVREVFNGVASDGELKAIRSMSAMEDGVVATISEFRREWLLYLWRMIRPCLVADE